MSKKYPIEKVAVEFVEKMILGAFETKGYFPLGRFVAEDAAGRFFAVDNSTGNAWTEDFPSSDIAEKWLGGEFEVDGWDRTRKSQKQKKLDAARRQILDEVIEELAFADGIGSWKEAVAVVEKLKVKN